MTSMFNDAGKNLPCTVLEVEPSVVTQVRTEEKDGYNAVQLGYGERKEKNTPAALKGHFKKAKTSPKMHVVEFHDFEEEMALGATIDVNMFAEGDFVDVTGTSKGKGFQGVVKRHNFSGVGGQTHGQHNRGRAPGSLGAASTPSRVFKGMKMAGRTGGNRVKVINLQVMKLVPEKNLILLSGSVPGSKNSYVVLEK